MVNNSPLGGHVEDNLNHTIQKFRPQPFENEFARKILTGTPGASGNLSKANSNQSLVKSQPGLISVPVSLDLPPLEISITNDKLISIMGKVQTNLSSFLNSTLLFLFITIISVILICLYQGSEYYNSPICYKSQTGGVCDSKLDHELYPLTKTPDHISPFRALPCLCMHPTEISSPDPQNPSISKFEQVKSIQ